MEICKMMTVNTYSKINFQPRAYGEQGLLLIFLQQLKWSLFLLLVTVFSCLTVGNIIVLYGGFSPGLLSIVFLLQEGKFTVTIICGTSHL